MKYSSTIVKVVFIALFLGVLLTSAALVNSIRIANEGKRDAFAALNAIEENDFDRALNHLLLLEDELDRAKSWQAPSKWMRFIPLLGADYAVYDELLSAGNQIASSARTVVSNLSETGLPENFSLDTIDLRTAPKAYLEVHEDILESIDHIQAAAEEADKLHISLAPASFRADLVRLRTILSGVNEQITEYRPLIEVLPELLGRDEPHDILVLLQNPDELRPTGGFIGSFGRISINKGVIEQFFTEDIYNLDVNALGREELLAPQPIQDYTDVQYWYLRDANWSPDFPTAAKQVIDLYEFESGEEDIDTVIAVTPFLIERFLAITGSIEVDNIVFDSENLVDAIQYRVEQEFWRIGLSDQERKKIINDLAQALKDRLFSLTKDELIQVLTAAEDALDRGEILFYTRDPQLNAYIANSGWDGSITQEKGDYIYVVDANLGALKTDRVVERARNYTVEKTGDGRWKARLKIRYKNDGFFDYRTTRYRTYTRIYTPLGSEFISSSGFVRKDKSSSYIDPVIYTELNKTVFAGFLSIEPGQERFAVVEYYLAPKVVNQIETKNQYTLNFIKQPGAAPIALQVQFTADRELFSFAPSEVDYELNNDQTISFTDMVERDHEYVIKLAE
jgi:hypothetical protein